MAFHLLSGKPAFPFCFLRFSQSKPVGPRTKQPITLCFDLPRNLCLCKRLSRSATMQTLLLRPTAYVPTATCSTKHRQPCPSIRPAARRMAGPLSAAGGDSKGADNSKESRVCTALCMCLCVAVCECVYMAELYYKSRLFPTLIRVARHAVATLLNARNLDALLSYRELPLALCTSSWLRLCEVANRRMLCPRASNAVQSCHELAKAQAHGCDCVVHVLMAL